MLYTLRSGAQVKGAKYFVSLWNDGMTVDNMLHAFLDDMSKCFTCVGSDPDLAVILCATDSIPMLKEFELRGEKLSKLLGYKLPLHWFQNCCMETAQHDRKILDLVHCFDGMSGDWKPNSKFLDWLDFIGYKYESGNAVWVTAGSRK